MHHARHLGLKVDLIVGDFDSGIEEDLAYFEGQSVKIERFKVEKDETDTEIAVLRAIEKGATEIDIFGGLGSRLDHTLANVQLLYKLLAHGCKGRLMNPNNTVYLVKDEIYISGQCGDLVSLIPFAGTVKGVTTQHLAYALHDSEIPLGCSLGISNYLTAPEA